MLRANVCKKDGFATMRSSISGAGAQGRKSNLYVFDADRTSVLNVKRLKEHREHDFEIELFANFNNHCYLFALYLVRIKRRLQ